MEKSYPTGMIDIETLKREWAEFLTIPFPDYPKDNRLADIGIDLDLYDTEVAGIVTSFIDGRKVDKKLIYIDQMLSNKLRAYKPPNIELKNICNKLIDRKNRLDRLVKLVLELYDTAF